MTNMEDSQIDVNLYLDELKSDDQNLRINAVTRLKKIANNLSTLWIEEELIPYLVFIICELDNEDEFLILLAESLIDLLKN